MKNKAPLMLIELTVMLLVLALAAGLCLRAFVWADGRAERNAFRDNALIHLQSAAEVLKANRGDLETACEACGGSVEGGIWTVPLGESGFLRAALQPSADPCLGTAVLEAVYCSEVLTELTVCWQEVAYGE